MTNNPDILNHSLHFPLYLNNGKENVRWTFLAKGRECRADGLYEYGQRYYAPWLCRFVSVDPIAEDYPQLSSYNYAGNKPITSPDVEGLQGTEDKKHDERKKDDGRNIKDGIRSNKDVAYEMHNLPANPRDGQQQSYYYTKGDTRQAQWTYNKDKDAWGVSTAKFAELRDDNIKPATSFWFSAKHSETDSTDTPGFDDSTTAHELASEESKTLENVNKEPNTRVETIINEIHDIITSDDGNSVVAVSDIMNSALDSAAKDAQNFKPKYGHSNPNVNAPTKLNRFLKFTGVASKVLGFTSMYQHGNEALEAWKKGDKKNAALSTVKVIVDGVFTFAKSNPVILGLSILYNVLDIGGFLKF